MPEGRARRPGFEAWLCYGTARGWGGGGGAPHLSLHLTHSEYHLEERKVGLSDSPRIQRTPSVAIHCEAAPLFSA